MADEQEERVGLDHDELPRAGAAISYIADKRILNRLGYLKATASQLVREPHLPIRAGVLPFHLEPSDWRTGYLNVRDYERPFELSDDLKECTPQALLRDLYRPEYESRWHERELVVTLDFGGKQAHDQALAAQKREPLPYVKPLVGEVRDQAARWRQVLRQRWLPILDDSAPRKRVEVITDPTLNW